MRPEPPLPNTMLGEEAPDPDGRIKYGKMNPSKPPALVLETT